jgi:hypothetical protein
MQPSTKRTLLPEEIIPWKRIVCAILLFGVAFGYLEAAVVSYLRMIHAPVARRIYPQRAPDDLFPLLTTAQVRAAAPEQMRTILTEIGREAATIVMLAAVALAVARNAGQWAAAFAIAFGAWDIAFYVFLKLLLDWPASLATWDILFLIPVPWVGPVLAPSIVSASMIAAGIRHLRREALGRPIALRLWHWAGIALGAAVIIVSFTLDYRNVMTGGFPHPFPWIIFAAGETIGVASYALATRTGGSRKPGL